MDAPGWRRFVRLSVTEGALATAMGTLMSGVVLTGLALSLGASQVVIGLLATLPSLANVAQLLGARWLNAGINRKRLCLGSLAAGRLLWLAVLGVPVAAAVGRPEWAVAGLVALVAASSVLSSIGGVAWLSWIRDVVPIERRLGFLGLRNQVDTALALGLSVAGAGLIDWSRAGDSQAIGGFIWVLMAAMLCGLAGIPILNRIADPQSATSRLRTEDAADVVVAYALPTEKKNFRNLFLFYISWNLSSNLAAPFFAVFMLQTMKLPFWQITALQALASLAALAANGAWTKLGKRLGTRPVVFIATLCDAFYPLCWIFLTPDAGWVLPLLFLFGAFNTPLAVGAPTLVMRLAPDHKASSYLAKFNAIIGVVMAAAAVLGGYLAGAVAGDSLAVGGLALGGLQLVFLLSFAGRLGSLWLLRRVVEPGELPLAELVRKAMAARVVRRPAVVLKSAPVNRATAAFLEAFDLSA